MSFYEQIAPYYQYIFPLQNSQINFINEIYKYPRKTSLLEVGCGIGLLSFTLANLGYKLTAFDLDEGMLKEALNTLHRNYPCLDNLEFLRLNMLDISNAFLKNSFDGILCFGNTLVHLNTRDDILNFLIQSKELLKSSSTLQFQILNYDRLIDFKIPSLPIINNDLITFERYYVYSTDVSLPIQFKTILTIKKTKQIIENNIHLIPLRKRDVEELLIKAGYSKYKIFGTYNRDLYEFTSDSIVVEAIK